MNKARMEMEVGKSEKVKKNQNVCIDVNMWMNIKWGWGRDSDTQL